MNDDYAYPNNNTNKRPLSRPAARKPMPSSRYDSPSRPAPVGRRAAPQRPISSSQYATAQHPTAQPSVADEQLGYDGLSQSLEGINQASTSQPTVPAHGAKGNKSLLTGLTCGLIGLILGGAGVFAVMQIINRPAECPECNCPPAGQDPQSKTSDDLTLDFLKLENSTDNIIYSPLSIRNGLALLDAGADGTTKTEISKLLGDTELPKYENVPDTLSLANAVFIRDTFQENVLPEYASTVENDYGAEIFYDNFENTANMDNWVSQKTFGLINNIGITPDPDTTMVLTNALAIQDNWTHPFEPEDTTGAPFHSASGEEIEAATMSQITSDDDVSYLQNENTTALALPLEPVSGANLEFVAVMPNDGDLGNYISNTTMDDISSLLSEMTPASMEENGIQINIPRFKYDYKLKFKDDLVSLGMTSAFDRDAADFSKMANMPLHVSQAAHEANIDFTEVGVKAAARTTFAMTMEAATEQPIPAAIVNFDHPFLFLIHDKSNGAVWFTGAVYQPQTWGETQTDPQE